MARPRPPQRFATRARARVRGSPWSCRGYCAARDLGASPMLVAQVAAYASSSAVDRSAVESALPGGEARYGVVDAEDWHVGSFGAEGARIESKSRTPSDGLLLRLRFQQQVAEQPAPGEPESVEQPMNRHHARNADPVGARELADSVDAGERHRGRE